MGEHLEQDLEHEPDPLEISLSAFQIVRLAEIARNHPYSITIRNTGHSWLELDLHSESGEVIGLERLLYGGEEDSENG